MDPIEITVITAKVLLEFLCAVVIGCFAGIIFTAFKRGRHSSTDDVYDYIRTLANQLPKRDPELIKICDLKRSLLCRVLTVSIFGSFLDFSAPLWALSNISGFSIALLVGTIAIGPPLFSMHAMKCLGVTSVSLRSPVDTA